jgi:hypothetical protein
MRWLSDASFSGAVQQPLFDEQTVIFGDEQKYPI